MIAHTKASKDEKKKDDADTMKIWIQILSRLIT